MIDNERVKRLSEEFLEQLSDMSDSFDCYNLECRECPFELEEPYKREGPYLTYRCSLGYAKLLLAKQRYGSDSV